MERKVGRIPARLPNGSNAPAELVGQTFGILEIIAQEPGRWHQGGYTLWRARCSCGNEIVRPSFRFLNKRYGMKCCPDCMPIGRPRVPNQGAHVHALYANRRRDAVVVRGLAFTLTEAEARALFEGNCAYCGTPPTATYTHKNLSGSYAFNGIDRIDSTLGYEPGNVVSSCWRCNRSKASMPVAEFHAWIERVHQHMSGQQARVDLRLAP